MRLTTLLPAALLLALVWATDLTAILGAHPWWSGKVVLIGAALGLALVWLASLRIAALPLTLTFLVATGLAGAAAVLGKRAFVASFGDNALAGQFWFFGWVATMAALAALVTALTQLIRQR